MRNGALAWRVEPPDTRSYYGTLLRLLENQRSSCYKLFDKDVLVLPLVLFLSISEAIVNMSLYLRPSKAVFV